MDPFRLQLSRSIKRCEFHPLQLRLYTYDLLNLPSFLKKFVKDPIAVVQPETDDEVVKVLKISEKFNVPVIPRGSATSAYGGVIPIKKSIVLDFTRMNKIRVEDKRLIAESGAIWLNVEKELNRHNLSLRVYPTSAPISTVGGWLGQGGYGVGSYKYGGIHKNVEWLEVADFGGIKKVSGDYLKYYIGLHGTTGFILRACIKTRERKAIESVTINTNFERSTELLNDAYHAVFLSKEFLKYSGWGEQDTLLLSFEGDPMLDGDREFGSFLWENRYLQLRASKFGKLIFSEAVIPYDSAPEFLSKCRELKAGVEVIFCDDCTVFFGMFWLNQYYSSIAKALKFIKMAEKFDGRVYSTGLLFPHKKIFNENIYEYKSKNDPKNLLNPGKALGGNIISNIVRISELVV